MTNIDLKRWSLITKVPHNWRGVGNDGERWPAGGRGGEARAVWWRWRSRNLKMENKR